MTSHLKPGAWFELAELGTRAFSDDNSMPEDWAPNQSFNLAVEALGKLGRIVPTAEWLEKLLVDAGFVEVEVSDSSTFGKTNPGPQLQRRMACADVRILGQDV